MKSPSTSDFRINCAGIGANEKEQSPRGQKSEADNNEQPFTTRCIDNAPGGRLEADGQHALEGQGVTNASRIPPTGRQIRGQKRA